ncbi:MAG: DNA topoisomerase VI subunit B [Planctomycetes bacterium]|nr:DNA topoisomerase VI subunit B [Planctomycetota bacterium]
MAATQREISISEFFAKNRHLLGFDNPKKALLTTIKEAVDNSMDACEEAGILPEILVEINAVDGQDDRFQVVIEDNGPGIVKAQVPNIFGKLLYGSKFHSRRQSRGQQGIGISAAGLYAQMTTGKGPEIISKVTRKKAHHFALQMDSTKNKPMITRDDELDDWHLKHGTRFMATIEATYKRGKRSVQEYL